MAKQHQDQHLDNAGRGTPSLSDAELANVVGRAQRLAQAEAEPRGHSPAEVAQVAAELELAPQHVATALAELAQERETAALAPRVRKERRLTWALAALSGLAVLALAGFVAAWSAAADVQGAAADLAASRARLGATLDRQARTISTQASAAGARSDVLAQGTAISTDPLDIDTRESDVARMVRAATQALAQLPPPRSAAEAQQRLGLGYELTGAENRSAVERARYQAALARWQAVSSTLAGRLSLGFGLARAP